MSVFRTLLSNVLSLSICIATSLVAVAEVPVGGDAPLFTLKDSGGNEVSLQGFRGKIVVLEWFNPNCPFVKKFYSRGNMQRFQEDALAQGVVWLSVSSAAPGKNGHLTPEQAEETRKELKMKSNALLLDSEGTVGRSFGARTTPHLFVVDAQGKLAYAGAIDSVASTSSSDIEGATNYVKQAIDALRGGTKVDPASTEPYGCSVKY